MARIKVSEATGAVLDWMVAKAAGRYETWIRDESRPGLSIKDIGLDDEGRLMVYRSGDRKTPYVSWSPSTNWSQCGPIIEREHIEWQWLPAPDKAHQYGARKPSLGGRQRTFCMDGPTVLVAAMRCFVASKLGDEVDVPDELIHGRSTSP